PLRRFLAYSSLSGGHIKAERLYESGDIQRFPLFLEWHPDKYELSFRRHAELAPTVLDFENRFGQFRSVHCVLAVHIRDISLGVARQLCTLVLSRVPAAWFERIGSY